MIFILGLLSVVAVLASVLLMFVVLLQEPKGGGLAAALGGSGMEAIGPSVGGVNRFTAWVAGIWMFACFVHAWRMTPHMKGDDAAKTPPAQQGGQEPGGGGGAPTNGGDKPK